MFSLGARAAQLPWVTSWRIWSETTRSVLRCKRLCRARGLTPQMDAPLMSEPVPGNSYTQHYKQAKRAERAKAGRAGQVKLAGATCNHHHNTKQRHKARGGTRGRVLRISPLPAPPSHYIPWDFSPRGPLPLQHPPVQSHELHTACKTRPAKLTHITS